jgi:hypothetical protein
MDVRKIQISKKMNGNLVQKPTTVQIIAVTGSVVLAVVGMVALSWCVINKIYIDSTLLISISTITGGVASSLTTILVGRTISNLNQVNDPDETKPSVDKTTKT